MRHFNSDHRHYIFFGHGWSIPGSIELNINHQVQVISLREERFFTESRDFNIMTYIKHAKSVQDYYNSLLAYTENSGNEVCVYSYPSYNFVPNMLLSTGKMKNSNELTGFFNQQNLNITEETISVQTLEELLIKVGKNVTIVIFACRVPLNIDDIKVMSSYQGYFMNDNDIVDYIIERNIPIGSPTFKKIYSKSFDKWLVCYSENDKNRRKNEYKKEQRRQKQIEYKKQKKQQKVMTELKPLIPSLNAWRPSFMIKREKDKYDVGQCEPYF